MALNPHTRTVSFSTGSSVSIASSSLWSMYVSQANYTVVYKPMNLNAVTNILLQDAVGRLAMIIPSSDAKSILCLYYADTCFRLFKIDPIRPQEVNPPTNYLNYIVLKRSGDIQPATDQEWHEAYAYVKEVSPKIFNNEAGTTFDFGVWRFHYSRSFLLDRIENQIDNTKAGFSD